MTSLHLVISVRKMIDKSFSTKIISKPYKYNMSRKFLGRAIVQLKEYVNLRDETGNTPCHIAARRLDSLAVELLANCGADMNIQGRDGTTVLDILLMRDFVRVGARYRGNGN